MTKYEYLLISFLLFTVMVNAQYAESVQEDRFFKNSILHSASISGEHTTLSAAVVAAELDQILDNDGPFTVFAPSDSAFDKWSVRKMNDLLQPQNKTELQSLLTYHIVAGRITASNILKAMCRGGGVATFTTVQGNILTATMEGIDIVLVDNLGNRARITTADENRCNGIVHVIDSVILPEKI